MNKDKSPNNTHKIYIISDTELGRGDMMDDFNDDQTLVNFIQSVGAKHPHENVTLVFNGDSFDYLKMAYRGKYPRVITEEISLWKTAEIFKAHPLVFNALGEFLKNQQNQLVFVIGNHDADLVWHKVQAAFREKLGNEHQVHFTFHFHYKDVHAEHGHLLDPFFYTNIRKPIINYKNQQILNLPWGSRIVFSHLIKVKQKFPNEEKIQPITLYAKKHPELKKFIRRNLAGIVLNKLILQPLIFFYDPTYSAPHFRIFTDVLRKKFKALSFDQYSKIEFKKIIKKHPHAKVVVLGHSHNLETFDFKGHKFLVTDTWRNEIDSRTMNKKNKTYAEIIYEKNILSGAELKNYT